LISKYESHSGIEARVCPWNGSSVKVSRVSSRKVLERLSESELGMGPVRSQREEYDSSWGTWKVVREPPAALVPSRSDGRQGENREETTPKPVKALPSFLESPEIPRPRVVGEEALIDTRAGVIGVLEKKEGSSAREVSGSVSSEVSLMREMSKEPLKECSSTSNSVDGSQKGSA